MDINDQNKKIRILVQIIQRIMISLHLRTLEKSQKVSEDIGWNVMMKISKNEDSCLVIIFLYSHIQLAFQYSNINMLFLYSDNTHAKQTGETVFKYQIFSKAVFIRLDEIK